MAKLTNVGETIWLSGPLRKGVMALALHAEAKANDWVSSNFFYLTDMIFPGHSSVVNAIFTIPKGTADLRWMLGLFSHEICWFSQTEILPVDLISVNKNSKNQGSLLGELKYLEKIIDVEGGEEKGLISDKEILVYSPSKTGSVTLLQSVGNYLSQKCKREEPVINLLLHSHSNMTVLENIKSIEDGIDRDFLKTRSIVKDLIEYKRLKNKPLIIISSFREPLSRAISNVFQRVDNLVYRDRKIAPGGFDYDKYLSLLYRFVRMKNFRHPIEEIEPDFFATNQFDKDRKCLLVDRGHCKILLVCLEHSDRWKNILATELGFDGIEMTLHNQASEKMVAQMYSDFKSNLSLPRAFIKNLYFNSSYVKYLRWFYTEGEIEAFFQQSLGKHGSKQLPVEMESYESLIRAFLKAIALFLHQHHQLQRLVIFTCSLIPPLNRRVWGLVDKLGVRIAPRNTPVHEKKYFHPESKRIASQTERILSRIDVLRNLRAGHKVNDSSINTPRLAYVSPVPPAMSGIAYYSCEILFEMAKFYDVTVIVDQGVISGVDLPTQDVEWFKRNYHLFDRVMYHIGNSSHHTHMIDLLNLYPGVVVFHDIYLGNLFYEMNSKSYKQGTFDRQIYLSHGYGALKYQQQHGREEAIWRFPLSAETMDASFGVIVHSYFARDILRSMCRGEKGKSILAH